MPPWPFRKMKLTISGFPAAAYLSLKTIWSNICRQWNCFKAFCWYLGYTFSPNHSDQTWSQSCWKALLPFLREPGVDIPTKVFNYLYEFGLRPIRPFIICKFLENRHSAHIWATLALRLQVGHHRTQQQYIYMYKLNLGTGHVILCLGALYYCFSIPNVDDYKYIYIVYACVCMQVQFSGNLYVFLISYIYTYIYICICKYLQTSPSIQLCSPEIGNDIP